MTIGTAEELANFRSLAAVPTGLEATYELALELALGTVQDEVDQRLEYVSGETITLVGSGARELLLPELPVVDVLEVTVLPDGEDSAELVEDDWTLAAGDDGRFAVLYRNDGYRWPKAPGLVTVTYSHGYGSGDYGPPVPAGLKAIIYRLASRGLSNPDSLAQQTAGRWSATYGAASGVTLTATDKLALDRYRPGRRH